MAGALLLVGTVVSALSLVGTASAGTGPGASGNTITNAAQAQTPFSPGTFDSGQPINVVVPANAVFAPGATIFILECTAPNGVNPTTSNSCDGNTAYGGGTIVSNADGSVNLTTTTTGSGLPYTLYALPDAPTLAEPPTHLPKCGLGSANECVLYIGQGGGNDTGFSQPHFFSQAFQVHPDPTDSGTLSPGDGTFPADSAPAITSVNHATFNQGTPGTFTVTATGYGPPAFTETGALPIGVTLKANTGVLAGTPTQSGSFPITIKASNGVTPDATQTFTLTVGGAATAPAITSANHATFTQGAAGIFTVTATGSPVPTLAESGALPAGVTFSPGTGALAGTPTVSGSFPITFTATNGVGSPATQSFTLTVTSSQTAPAITSVTGTTFTQGTAGAFTVTATGSPKPTLAESGALPAGVTFAPGTGVLAGTPSVTGTFPVTFTATNGVGSPATQSFTLTVNPAGSLTVSASKSTVVANPTSVQTGPPGTQVTVTLLAADGTTPIPGKPVTLTVSGTAFLPNGNLANSDGGGHATFTVTDSVVESVTVTATGDTVPLTAAPVVMFTAPAAPSISPTASTVLVTGGAGTLADGFTEVLVDVTINDTAGHAMAGVPVQVTASPNTTALVSASTSSQTPGVTDSSGSTQFGVRDTTAETLTFSVTAGHTATSAGVVLSTQPTATFVAGAVDANLGSDPKLSRVVAAPQAVAADGTAASTVTVTLTDHFGNAVKGKTVTLAASGGSSTILPSPNQVTTDTAGVATFTVTDAHNEVVTYSATNTSDALPLAVLASVTFGTPPPVVPIQADSTIQASASTVVGDGQTAATISLTLRDANGFPVGGKSVSLSASGGSSVIVAGPTNLIAKANNRRALASPAPTVTTNSNGNAAFNVTDTVAESVTYAATDVTDSISGWTVAVVFTAAPPASTTTTTTPTTAASTSTSTAVPSAASASASGGTTPTDNSAGTGGTSGTSGPLLAFTGAPAVLPWMFGLGSLCLLGGSFGRRALALRRRERQ